METPVPSKQNQVGSWRWLFWLRPVYKIQTLKSTEDLVKLLNSTTTSSGFKTVRFNTKEVVVQSDFYEMRWRFIEMKSGATKIEVKATFRKAEALIFKISAAAFLASTSERLVRMIDPSGFMGFSYVVFVVVGYFSGRFLIGEMLKKIRTDLVRFRECLVKVISIAE